MGNIKAYAIAAIGALVALVGVFFGGKVIGRKDQEIKQEKRAREVEHLGYEAADAGKTREQQIRQEKVDPKDRSFFE